MKDIPYYIYLIITLHCKKTCKPQLLFSAIQKKGWILPSPFSLILFRIQQQLQASSTALAPTPPRCLLSSSIFWLCRILQGLLVFFRSRSTFLLLVQIQYVSLVSLHILPRCQQVLQTTYVFPLVGMQRLWFERTEA